jgi:hypothetical protein
MLKGRVVAVGLFTPREAAATKPLGSQQIGGGDRKKKKKRTCRRL